ncbi:hypothetical protein LPJ66_002406 [Kickxella alabastrina]|uniref:Uncharacterized protein n=1 Tax=Kickxella alabastrina TaxID=61397 RepID=A0ACC1IQM6_9FUNG|nr:hypothetical protein LPJ66_002406 [Kickxella alabastrina]
MSEDAGFCADGAIGYLQRKSRFYGWSKSLFHLDQHGLAQLSSDQLPSPRNPLAQRSPQSAQQPLKLVIGNLGAVDPHQAARLKCKKLTNLSQISGVSVQGQRDFVIRLQTEAIVLRAQTPGDRDLWIETIQYFIDAEVGGDNAPWFARQSSDNYIADTDSQRSAAAADAASDIISPRIQNLPSAVTSGMILQSTGTGLDVESFDADLFFNEEYPEAASVNDLSPQSPTTSQAQMQLHAYNHARDFANVLSSSAYSASLRANSKVLPLAAALDTGLSPGYSDSYGFGNLFDFMQEPHTDKPPGQSADVLQTMLSLSMLSVPASPHQKHMRMTSSGKPAQGTLQTEVVAFPATTTGGYSDCANVFSNDDEADPDVPLGALMSSIDTRRTQTTASCTAADAGMVNSVTMPSQPATSGVALSPSIADFTGSILDNIGLTDWTSMLSDSVSVANCALTGAAAHTGPTAPPCESHSGVDNHEHQARGRLLDSPGHNLLTDNSSVIYQSTATIGNSRSKRDISQLDEPTRSFGLQTALLSKYSESLNASRALHTTVGRSSRPSGIHDRRDRGIPMANDSMASFRSQAVPIVQYESVEPTNIGISKVVRGQINRGVVQRKIEIKPEAAVRRMRRVKSESKIMPLKAIRLKLNSSIINHKEPINHSSILACGQNNGSRDNRSEAIINVYSSNMPLAQSQVINTSSISGIATVELGGHESRQTQDVFGDFNTIQERLKVVERHKQLQQQARILDKDGIDNVRISDIIEKRQDVPLAVQIEERRRVQVAKQQALLSQQLEQQRMQIELQKLNMEQHQQHQQFKRQSLHPLHLGGDSYASHLAQYPSTYSSIGAAPTYAQQQAQQHQHMRSVSSQGFFKQQLDNQCYSLPPRSTTRLAGPAFVHEPSVAWTQQQQQQVGRGRPLSYYGTQPSASSFQHMDIHGRSPARSHSTVFARPPNSVFVKQPHATQPVNSNNRSDSWQRGTGNNSASASIHAKTEPSQNGSIRARSPGLSSAAAKRSASYGNGNHRQVASMRSGVAFSGSKMPYSQHGIPPVPPLPHTSGNFVQHGYLHSPMQGLPAYSQPSHGQWGAPQPMHASMPGHAAYGYYQPAYGDSSPTYTMHASNDHMAAGMHKISQRRAEMSTETPSLLQRLDLARVSGILPGRHTEKMPYSQGGYQHQNASQIIREGSSAQYLGNGNTLLIDRVYETEKTRAAFLKKISRSYTGIGGDPAPPPVFMH